MSDYSDKLRREQREELALRMSSIEEACGFYTYEVEVDEEEFGSLPPFIKANIIKGLEKKLAAESDDVKKAEIQAKIDKLKNDKKELAYEITVGDIDFGSLPPFLKAGMIKGLEKKLAAETDDDKKAEIQVKIDKLKGDKKAELVSRVDFIISEGEEIELGITKWLEKLHPRSKDGKFDKGSKKGGNPGANLVRGVNKKAGEVGKKLGEAGEEVVERIEKTLEKAGEEIEKKVKKAEHEKRQAERKKKQDKNRKAVKGFIKKITG